MIGICFNRQFSNLQITEEEIGILDMTFFYEISKLQLKTLVHHNDIRVIFSSIYVFYAVVSEIF